MKTTPTSGETIEPQDRDVIGIKIDGEHIIFVEDWGDLEPEDLDVPDERPSVPATQEAV